MRFAQSDGSGGGISITFPTVDWTQLVPQLVGLFFNAIGTWLQNALHSTFDGVWSGDHNVIAQTPIAMTWGLGAVQVQVVDLQTAARAVLLFALVLLGLKSMLGGVVHAHRDVVGEFVNGVLMSVILVAAFPLVIPLCINLVNQAASAVAGSASVASYLTAGGTAPDPMIGAVLFLILLFFALRLLMRAVWRIGFLAVLLPVGLAACALYAVPQMRWLLAWWARTWGGMLAAQIPSVFALSIGVGLFLGGSGVGSMVYSIAFLQLATDLYTLIPFGFVGSSGAPWGSIPWRAPLAAMGLAGQGAAAASRAIPRNEIATMADRYGY